MKPFEKRGRTKQLRMLSKAVQLEETMDLGLTRLEMVSGVLIVFMFVGAGVASWAGTSAYDTWGWTGNAVLALLASITVLCLCIFAHTNHQRSKNK